MDGCVPVVKDYRLEVTTDKAGQRLDVFLAEQIPELSRSQAKRLIREGLVQIQGKRPLPKYLVKAGEQIQVQVPPPEEPSLEPEEEVPFEILYEDQDLAVINKPPGVVVHPAAGHFTGTLVHGLLARLKDLSGVGGELRPGIVHRLDKDTSGLLLVAKNDQAHQELTRQFKAREVSKVYLALVHGSLAAESGKIDYPIGRHPVHRKKMSIHAKKARTALTLWKVRERFRKATLLEVRLLTGRTHQIRVHLSAIGHPIVGDVLYGGARPQGPKAPRQMLHAWHIRFLHPRTRKELAFEAPLPEDFVRLLEDLRGVKDKKGRLKPA